MNVGVSCVVELCEGYVLAISGGIRCDVLLALAVSVLSNNSLFRVFIFKCDSSQMAGVAVCSKIS